MLKDARIVRTRARLQKAILELVATTPFDDLTVREITDRAATGYATFFRHYSSKEVLLEDAAALEINRLVVVALKALNDVDIRESCLILCRHIDADRSLWTALLTGHARSTIKDELVRISVQVAAERARSWPPQHIGVTVAIGAIVEILGWWLTQPSNYPLENIARLIDELVVTPGTAAQR